MQPQNKSWQKKTKKKNVIAPKTNLDLMRLKICVKTGLGISLKKGTFGNCDGCLFDCNVSLGDSGEILGFGRDCFLFCFLLLINLVIRSMK